MNHPRNPFITIIDNQWSDKKLILVGLVVVTIPILSIIPAILCEV